MRLAGFWSIFEEGALAETLQWVLLAAAVLLCLSELLRRQPRLSRNLLLLFVLFFVTLLLRELDVEDLALPQVLVALGSGPGRDVWLGASWAISGCFAISRWRCWLPRLPQVLLGVKEAWGFLLGCGCYAASLAFDKAWFPLAPAVNLAAEETLELLGCFFLLINVFLIVRREKMSPSPERQPTEG